MKLSNEQLNSIMAKADNDLDALKDRCHDLYEENLLLKKKCNMYEMRMYEEENSKNAYKATIDKAVAYCKMVIKDKNGIYLDMPRYILELLQGGKK